MAIVSRWPQRRITLDGSAAIANAIYVQTERDFDAQASYEDVKQTRFAPITLQNSQKFQVWLPHA